MNLREYLETYKITQAEFADLIGVEQSTISNWVMGIRKPRPKYAEIIVKKTNKKVGYADLYAGPCCAGENKKESSPATSPA